MRFAILGLLATAATPPPAAGSCAVTLAGAHIFTGTGFETRDLAVRDGRFVASDAAAPRIDATKLWLIPPLIDAHTHTIDTPTAKNAADHRRFVSEGVFYALNPNNIRPQGPDAPATDDRVEIVAAGAGVTRPGGHPTQLYPAGMDGKAYHLAATPAEARAAVARVKANGSRFVKLYLLNHTDPGGGEGLSAAAFGAAVAEAKRLGLRPIAHIEDAADFRLAVAAKVHALMHLPYWPPSAKPARAAATLTIDRADAQAAAAAAIVVVPTAMLSMAQFDGKALAEVVAIERHNYSLLRDAGVRFAVGEDFIGGMHDEIAALRSFALFDGPEMLRIATENGAALAFPERKLGRLATGYEASFLAFRANPLDNWVRLRSPAAGIRAGRVLIDDGMLATACKAGSAGG